MTQRGRLDPWDLLDPGDVITQVGAMRSLRVGRTILAAVRFGDEHDQVVAIADLPDISESPHPEIDGSFGLHDIAEALLPDRRDGPPKHTFMTLVCREGRVVSSTSEISWFPVWRYSNHLTDAFSGDVYAVTPYGWCGTADKRSGAAPTASHLAIP